MRKIKCAQVALAMLVAAGCGREGPGNAIAAVSGAATAIVGPFVSIRTPVANQTLVVGTPFVVSGTAFGSVNDLVDSVTVQVDNQVPLVANLTFGGSEVTYSVTTTLGGPPASHTIKVVANLDNGTLHTSVTVVGSCASGTVSCGNACVAPGSAHSCTKASMTSWVQSDGPHVAYTDAAGAIHQLYTIATNDVWGGNQNLTSLTNAASAGPYSPVTSWVQSDGPHIAYTDALGGIHQLWYSIANGVWATQTLMTVANAISAGPNSPMTSWVQSDGPHIAYADASGAVRQLFYTTATGAWTAQDLSAVTNAPAAGPNSPMTSWVQSDGPHIAYADASGAIHQLYSNASAWGGDQNLSALTNAAPAGANSPMTSWVQSDGPHIAYIDGAGGIRQLWYTTASGAWSAQTLMTVANVVAAGANSPMTSWVQSDGPHIAYTDGAGGIRQLWYTIASGAWSAQTLMTVPNAVAAGANSPMTSWVQPDGPHVAYPGTNGDVFQLWYDLGAAVWVSEDITAPM
jgi:hypothetical protein